MAGDRTLLPQAVEALRQFAADHPQDTGAQLALGKALTYQEATRRHGIDVLASMADGNKEADRSLYDRRCCGWRRRRRTPSAATRPGCSAIRRTAKFWITTAKTSAARRRGRALAR